jgi:hypothetical protein
MYVGVRENAKRIETRLRIFSLLVRSSVENVPQFPSLSSIWNWSLLCWVLLRVFLVFGAFQRGDTNAKK